MVSAYAAATEYVFSDDTDEMDLKITGGNSRLIDALVKDLYAQGHQLLRNAQVTRVRQDEAGVRVTFGRTGRTRRADCCICTVPARRLRAIHWDPPLPPAQAQAASELQYARIVKTAVLYKTRFWNRGDDYGFSAFTGRISDFCFDSTFPQAGAYGILCSYAVGDKADDVAQEPRKDKLVTWISEDMAGSSGVGTNVPVPVDSKSHAWQQDPHVLGAYAIFRPGQALTVARELARPFGRVHFAGEHLADWQGFMEGAVATGQDAAAVVATTCACPP